MKDYDEVKPNLTAEERAFIRKGERMFEDAKGRRKVSKAMQERADEDAKTSAALMFPGPAQDTHLKIEAMTTAEIEAKYGKFTYGNAFAERGALEKEEDRREETCDRPKSRRRPRTVAS